MRRAWEIVRIIIISPEMAALLTLVVLSSIFPSVFELIGNKFTAREALWEYIPVMPLGVFSFVLYLSFQLQAPVEGANRELYDWDMYWALKYRIIAGLCWSGLTVLASTGVWLFSDDIGPFRVGSFLTCAITISVIVAGSGILALFTLKEILEK